jgi:hypothetical protein
VAESPGTDASHLTGARIVPPDPQLKQTTPIDSQMVYVCSERAGSRMDSQTQRSVYKNDTIQTSQAASSPSALHSANPYIAYPKHINAEYRRFAPGLLPQPWIQKPARTKHDSTANTPNQHQQKPHSKTVPSNSHNRAASRPLARCARRTKTARIVTYISIVVHSYVHSRHMMALLCHSSDLVALSFRCFAIWVLALPLLFSFVREPGTALYMRHTVKVH